MDESFLGRIALFSFGYAPEGYTLCNGVTIPIAQNQALFSLIGVLYGGNGSTNFMLPNMQGMEPIPNMKYYIAINGIYPSRA